MAQTDIESLGKKPEQVAQLLDNLAASLMEQDFNRYAGMIALPFVLATNATRFVYATRDELRRTYDIWQRTIQAHDATQLVQRVRDIGHIGDDGLIIDYDTDLMSGDTLVLPTFKNFMFVRPRHGRLQIEQIVSGVSNARPSLFIKVDPDNTVPQMAMPPSQKNGENDAED